ncbi:MAG: DUF4338 domain-containing protein [Spirochaetales bacterium]|jgi:hypothetical protein|nr:DUF4338 domain-containing protein [Spirochaetales bacterium]
MEAVRRIQGRIVTDKDITLIQSIIAANPTWHRTRISQELCHLWNWKNDAGRLKDIAARAMLRKLDKENLIKLPAPVRSANNAYRYQSKQEKPKYERIEESLSNIQPIQINQVKTQAQARLFRSLLAHFHYLGYSGPVGENLRYLVYDCEDRILGCLLFGAPAWSVASRDRYIGWGEADRKKGLSRIANNMRFLILPEVKVPHLASHLLGKISRRVSVDWKNKYGHSIALLETYVENNRFKGTCYKAANWVKVGETTGQTRNYRAGKPKAPIKSVWLYPLGCLYRTRISGGRQS